MKKLSHDVKVHAPIEDVWALFDLSLKQTKRIMPNIVSVEPIEETEEMIGSSYRQVVRQKRTQQEFLIEVVEYEDTPTYKCLKTNFEIPNMLDVTNVYKMEKIDDRTTTFISETINIPLRWDMKILLFFTGKRSVVDLCRRVQEAAEKDFGIKQNEL